LAAVWLGADGGVLVSIVNCGCRVLEDDVTDWLGACVEDVDDLELPLSLSLAEVDDDAVGCGCDCGWDLDIVVEACGLVVTCCGGCAEVLEIVVPVWQIALRP
jgi:hypothetical protein